jgi:hypothetical protein
MRARDGLDPFTVPAVPRGLLSSFVLAFNSACTLSIEKAANSKIFNLSGR